MDRWRLPVGLAGELRWGRRGEEQLNWRFIYPIPCQGRLVCELSCVCSQNAKISMNCFFFKKSESMHWGGVCGREGGNQWPLVASSFKLPAALKAVLTGHYGCLLKTRQGREELSRDPSNIDTNTHIHTPACVTWAALQSYWCTPYNETTLHKITKKLFNCCVNSQQLPACICIYCSQQAVSKPYRWYIVHQKAQLLSF